ncbi:MAG: c-type cytochrome [Methylobacter sp.]|jgi:cytochrome c5|nr:c-type cytochrome [Methylobacter sp.]
MKFILISSTTLAVFLFAGQAHAADGQEVYSNNCAVCHAAMPPKLSDKSAWEPLIKKGTDVLVASVINGKGAMPPRAGKPELSDADISAAVEYMMTQAK